MADKQYKVIIEGEDGRGTQVFESETPEEMLGQFKQAQTHATQKIRDQQQEIERLSQLAMAQANGNGSQNQIVDRDQRVNDLLADPDGTIERVICAKLGVNSLQEVVQDYSGVRQVATMANVREVANNFANRHPEWLGLSEADRTKDGEVLGQIIEQYGLPYDHPESLETAYKIGLGSGKFKFLKGTVESPDLLPPVPTTVTRPSVQPNTSDSEQQFYQTAPLKDMRAYIEKKFGTK